jgi:hypothetical protein
MEFLKRLFFEHIPGMVYVLFVFTVLVSLTSGESAEHLGAKMLAGIVAASWLFFAMGHYLDNSIFGPLYGVDAQEKPWWPLRPLKLLLDRWPRTQELSTKRKAAADKLRPPHVMLLKSEQALEALRRVTGVLDPDNEASLRKVQLTVD